MRLNLLALLLFLAQNTFSQDGWQHMYEQAQTKYQNGNVQEAYRLAKRALIQAKIEYGSDYQDYVDNFRLLTLICYSSSKFQEGIDYASQEVHARQQLGQTHTTFYGQAHYNLGLLHMATGDLDAAVADLTKALSIFKYADEKQPIVQAQYQLGRAYQNAKQWALADSLYQKVVQLTQEDSLFREILLQTQYQRASMEVSRKGEEGVPLLLSLKDEIEQHQDTLSSVYINTLCLLADQEEKRGRVRAATGFYQKAKVLMESSHLIHDSLHYAHILDHLGILELGQGHVQQSEKHIEKAYHIRKRLLTFQDGYYWISVDHKAQVFQEKGQGEDAIRFYEDCIREAGMPADFPYQYVVVLNNLGLLYEEKGQYTDAKQYYDKAVTMINLYDTADTKVQLQKASIYYNVARHHQSQSHFDTAIYYYKRAVDWSKKYGGNTSPEYMAAISGMAALYQDIGYFTEAEIFYGEALHIQQAISGKESNAYANVLNNYALLVQAKGDYQQAEALLKEVIAIKKKLLGDQDPQTITVLSNLGLFYLETAAYKEARPLLEKALATHQQILSDNDPRLIAHLANIAKLEMAEANYTKAEPLLKKAVRMAEAYYGPDHPELAAAQLELANFYLTLGNYPVAEPLLQEGRRILQERYGLLHPDYATATQNMATLYEAIGKDSLAEALFLEALQIDRKALGKQHPEYAVSLNNLASFYQNSGRSMEALPLLEESLSISQNVFGKEHPVSTATLLNLGLLYQELEQYGKAEPVLDEVVILRKKLLGEKHPDYAYALYGKAVLYHRLGRYQEAVPIFHQAVDNYVQQIKSYFPALSEKEKGAFYKRIEPVLNAYRDFVVDVLINERYESNPNLRDKMLGELYNVQLITKAMLLDASSKIRKNILSSGDVALRQTYRAWITEKEKIAQAYTLSKKALAERGINIRALERKANELEKQLSSSSVLFAHDIEQKNLVWQNIQQRLANDEAAVEIIRGYKEKEDTIFYMALLIAPSLSSPRLAVLPQGKKMEGKNYFYYKNGIKFRVKDTLSYQVYWAHIKEMLPNNIKSVYIAPDGVYNKISLNSLYNISNGKFLLDEINIRMLSSTRELVEERVDGTSPQPQAYLFGFPNYRFEISSASEAVSDEEKNFHLIASATSEMYPYRFGITRLPGTQQEVNYIEDILQEFQWDTYKFMENVALEENIKQVKNPSLLHIATHGYFMSDLPLDDENKVFGIHLKSMATNPLLRSGLLLTGAENTIMASELDEEIVRDKDAEDGILTAYEAMNLDLNGTDLVVLSACETGLGDVRNGEGVYGLQRAFLMAGANSVMMSLWKVNDLATTELIKKFYYNWLSGQDKFMALRNAQIEIKEEYEDPYFWGAFVLIGR